MKLQIPIFPLNGVILFPKTNLPLNIFEERYLEMVDFALANKRMIGMIQTKNNNDLYDVGCLGKISSFDEASDGRYIINLTGLNYFSITKEVVSDYKFRLVQIENINESVNNYKENLSKINNEKLIRYYSEFIKDSNSEAEVNFLNKIETDLLVKFIAMSSPFSVAEKQMLLETTNISDLEKNLTALLQLYLSKEKGNNLIN
jgi:Lon protease-like protein